MTTPPDLIIVNGALITFDPSTQGATSIAIVGNKIHALGTDAEMRGLAGPDTQVIDATQATVMPGFIDSHVHLFCGSVELGYLDLHGIQGLAALKAAVAPYSDATPDDAILFAVQADYAILHSDNTPTRQELDSVCPDRPFAIFAPDHHTVWANTAALQLAGIVDGGETAAGCEIVMGDDGMATGELREPGAYAAVLALTRHGGRDLAGLISGKDPVPTPSAADRAKDKAALARGMKHCAAQGITGVQCMDGNFYQLELLTEMETEGTLLCRTSVPFHLRPEDPLDRLSEAATMAKTYPGTHDTYGDPVFGAEHFNAACTRIDAMGLQIAVHAIGDAGVRRTLDAYEIAQQTNGSRDSRHRIEHLETMHPDDIPRLAALGAVASIQPGHAPFGGIFPPTGVGKYLYPHQIPHAYPWTQLRDSGAKVIFSTDWPVIGVDVMTNIKAAIAPLDLGPGWVDQTQSLMQTLASYTCDNAWVEFREDQKGQLTPGMLADIVVLSHDITELEPAQITDASARLTICNGRITYAAE